MTAILNTLIEITIYSAIIFGVIWLFRLLLKKHASPAMLYVVWFLLIARLLVPVTVPSGFSFFVIPAGQTEEAEAQIAGLSALPAELDNTAVNNTNALSDGISPPTETAEAQNLTIETTAATPKPAQLHITWETALVTLWLAGVVIMLIQTAVSSVKLKKRLKSARPIPPGWQLIVEELEAELDMLRGVRVVMIAGFPSPALSAWFNPVVVLPEELLSHNDETVRFALLHELTHIRRKDHIISILLLVLRAVYWFNPVVWLTVKQVRLDMETACDNNLTKHMSSADKKQYASTILSMYASRQIRFALGMALGQTKKIAERRIKGIFMKGKSKMSTKLITVLLAVILIFTCFTTACQPTPEIPTIADNWGNDLEEMIASSAVSSLPEGATSSLAEAVGAPETFKDSYTNDNSDVTVTIDARVEVPSVDALPAVQVKLCGFQQEQVDRLAEYFLKGTPLFTEDRSVRTKEEIQDQMVYTQSQQQLEDLEKQYKEAPEQRKRTPATTKLNESQYGTDLWIVAELGKDEAAEFCVSNYKEYYYTFSYRNDGKGSYEAIPNETENQGEAAREMETTREEAEAAVIQCLSDLGIEGMQIESVETATFYSDWDKIGKKDYEASTKQCYAFNLVRTVMGVPVLNVGSSTPLETDDPNVPVPKEPEYNCIHEPETLEIYVDDTGIMRVEWRNPSEESAVLSEHVTLMPFSDIVQRAKDNMFFKNYTAYGSTAEIKITSIRLGMMRIALKDKPAKYLIVPVWDFIGNQKYSFDDHEDWGPFDSFVTINAIDGSMIHRNWGY